MAERKSYPSIPARNWWDLRSRFQQSLPTRVGPDYLQSVLTLGEGAAKNLIPQLTAVGLIDETGKPTQLAIDWRDDGTYAGACNAILESAYPDALRDAFPPPGPDRGAVEGWFARNAQVGKGAARKMAAFYLLVAAADPMAESQAAGKTGTQPRTPAKRVSASKPAAAQMGAQDVARAAAKVTLGDDGGGRAEDLGPTVHVDVQVHISPDASTEQIDQIFASMAKHLYPGRK